MKHLVMWPWISCAVGVRTRMGMYGVVMFAAGAGAGAWALDAGCVRVRPTGGRVALKMVLSPCVCARFHSGLRLGGEERVGEREERVGEKQTKILVLVRRIVVKLCMSYCATHLFVLFHLALLDRHRDEQRLPALLRRHHPASLRSTRLDIYAYMHLVAVRARSRA